MKRVLQSTLAALLLLANLSDASVILPLQSFDEVHHLGDQNWPDWVYPNNENLTFRMKFWLEGDFRSVRMDMLLSEVDLNNDEVVLNNVTVAYLCYPPSNEDASGFSPCNITLPLDNLRRGNNNLEIRSSFRDNPVRRDWDDFMFKMVKISAEYDEFEPRIIATKTQSSYEYRVQNPVAVTVHLVNVGYKKAYNVSIIDYKPSDTYIISGSNQAFLDDLAGGDLVMVRYLISSPNIGPVLSWPGRIAYLDDNGTFHETTIEPTHVDFRPPRPQVYAYKSISSNPVFVNEDVDVLITIVNNGTETAYNTQVFDYLPKGFKVQNSSLNSTIAVLEPGHNATHTYSLLSQVIGQYMASALILFEDSEGNRYSRLSAPLEFSTSNQQSRALVANPLLQFLAVLIAIAFLFLLYLRVKV